MNRLRENNSNWKGGITIDMGYRYIYQPDHHRALKHRGYVAEHVLIMEKKIGRYLLDGEEVHHIDHDKLNNDPDNLELLTKQEHTKRHAKPKTMIQLRCAYCGTIFEREARQVNSKINSGQIYFYCNRICGSSPFGTRRFKSILRGLA